MHLKPRPGKNTDLQISVISTSILTTAIHQILGKAVATTWIWARKGQPNAPPTSCCLEIDFTSKKEFGFVKSSKCANSRSIQDQLKIRDLSGLGTWFLIVVFTLTYFDAAGTCTLGRFQNSIFVTPPVRKHKSADI